MSGSSCGPADASNVGKGLGQSNNSRIIGHRKAAHKRDRVLLALLRGPLDTFQPEHAPVYDHCLPSTISELRKAGLAIATTMLEVVGYGGLAVRIAQYTLASESRQFATEMLGFPQ
jgi:hypothetical protein